MRCFKNYCFLPAALVFMVVLAASSGWAGTGPVITNCPAEPAQNVHMASGQTYFGTNCVLKTTGDVDEFKFTAAAGDVWQIVLGFGGSTQTTDLTLILYAPGLPLTQICNQTTDNNNYYYSVTCQQALTAAGTYTIQAMETESSVQSYAISLERLSPAPPDATTLSLSQSVTAGINAQTAQATYTFYAGTTGEYEIAASLTPNPNTDVCINVYQPNGTAAPTSPAVPQCTNQDFYLYSVSTDLVPSANGTFVVEVYAGGNDSTVGYNLEVSCLGGTCPPAKPPCDLADSPSYDAATGVLTMDFTVATPTAATWDGWLTIKNKSESIFSQSLPKTEPGSQVTQTRSGLAAYGTVGILSTITTPAQGITCSSFVTVDTGKP
jgi:hypothetical protein